MFQGTGDYVNDTTTTPGVSPPHRYPSGKKKAESQPRHAGHHTLWRRHRDNWDGMIKQGHNPMWGTVIGKLYLDGHITEFEASAARLFSELAGRYDRYFGTTRRTVPSPAYQSGLGGRDDEVERHEKQGTTKEYERRANKARKAWEKINRSIPNAHARDVIEEVCLYDREINSACHADLKILLGDIAKRFGFTPEATAGKPKSDARPLQPTDMQKRVWTATNVLERWFRDQGIKVDGFRLLVELPDMRGMSGYGTAKDGAEAHHTVQIMLGRALPEHVDALFLKAAEQKGWPERMGR